MFSFCLVLTCFAPVGSSPLHLLPNSPNETTDGAMADLFPDVDQGISELLDRLRVGLEVSQL